jgi:hypothetical protein
MLRRVALVRTDVSEELSASFITVTRIGELGTTLAVTSNRRTLLSSSETSVSTRATRRPIPEDGILRLHIYFRSFGLFALIMCTYVSVDIFSSGSPMRGAVLNNPEDHALANLSRIVTELQYL